MVCSIGSGRMAVMARLLAAGSFSQTMAEDVGHQKLAAQYICRELRDADEANLLDEEDMHVFGLKPMTEPLQLVCCNACKKPIKASQYAAHAGLCRSLNSAEENILEVNGSTGSRKPPRKERKKLLTAYANQTTPVGEQEKSQPIDADVAAASESQLDSQIGIASFALDAKPCVDVASMMDVSGVCTGNMDHPACVMLPPTKRSKLIAAGHQLLLDDLETASGVAKITNIPVPLATKIYYSQRNNRHRSTLAHLYREASTKELCNDMVSSKISQENMIPLQSSSPRDTSVEPMDEMLNRKIA
ncbi:uncharacterized protein LOC132184637 isoform X2 [Corylus avellana]|uniref:uncharacterized protein LOC132184637 isoform X2 n=1 Tax=Corylus avellana TaxID=13451 RepID=UPI00286A8B5D|nr:uncharacterized protein LOC132184637 isoform X2 [Corylus avellana]